ncbi:hypothetical protein [Nocardia sp. CA-135398]|uniref:hypothetical protein n=1 Tax=Nocardia sp. CA-135398 TaxID=3239977 RepID=UPI003D9724CA
MDIDEPSERGIEGIERIRLIRDDITTRVHTLLTGLREIAVNGKPQRPALTFTGKNY